MTLVLLKRNISQTLDTRKLENVNFQKRPQTLHAPIVCAIIENSLQNLWHVLQNLEQLLQDLEQLLQDLEQLLQLLEKVVSTAAFEAMSSVV